MDQVEQASRSGSEGLLRQCNKNLETKSWLQSKEKELKAVKKALDKAQMRIKAQQADKKLQSEEKKGMERKLKQEVDQLQQRAGLVSKNKDVALYMRMTTEERLAQSAKEQAEQRLQKDDIKRMEADLQARDAKVADLHNHLSKIKKAVIKSQNQLDAAERKVREAVEAKEAAMKKESGLAQALKEARQLGADQLATIAELKALLAAKSLENKAAAKESALIGERLQSGLVVNARRNRRSKAVKGKVGSQGPVEHPVLTNPTLIHPTPTHSAPSHRTQTVKKSPLAAIIPKATPLIGAASWAADAVDTGSPMVQAHRAVPAAAETVNSGQGVLELQALSGWTVVGNKGRARASGEPARVLQLPRGASAQHATVLTVKHPHSRNGSGHSKRSGRPNQGSSQNPLAPHRPAAGNRHR